MELSRKKNDQSHCLYRFHQKYTFLATLKGKNTNKLCEKTVVYKDESFQMKKW